MDQSCCSHARLPWLYIQPRGPWGFLTAKLPKIVLTTILFMPSLCCVLDDFGSFHFSHIHPFARGKQLHSADLPSWVTTYMANFTYIRKNGSSLRHNFVKNHGLPTSPGPHGGRHAGRGRRGRREPVQIPGPVGRGGDGPWRGSMWSIGSAGECAVQLGAGTIADNNG